MVLTEPQLKEIYPAAGQRVTAFLPALNEAMARWEIDHPKRVAAFLAQVGHESGQLRYVKELGATVTWHAMTPAAWPCAWATRPRPMATASAIVAVA
jgi:predicted chitinase